jgi:hypothetical protein
MGQLAISGDVTVTFHVYLSFTEYEGGGLLVDIIFDGKAKHTMNKVVRY